MKHAALLLVSSFLKKYFYLFIFGWAGSLLSCRLLSSCSMWTYHGGFTHRSTQDLGCSGFSSCGTWAKNSCSSQF